jgi:hypothetical protein
MVINQLYKKYFQKSKIMMYPLLGIERGNVSPEEVYLSINGKIRPEDRKLICVYDPNSDEAYSTFKQERLVNHSLLSDHMTNENGHELFIFDMKGFAKDWDYFLAGRYSKISENVKSQIQNYFEKNSGNYIFMNSFLYPEKWHKRYSELLDVSVSLLIEVVELTDKPDFEKETFHYNAVVIESETHRIDQKTHSHQCDRCHGQGIIPKYIHIANGVCFKCYGKSKVLVA